MRRYAARRAFHTVFYKTRYIATSLFIIDFTWQIWYNKCVLMDRKETEVNREKLLFTLIYRSCPKAQKRDSDAYFTAYERHRQRQQHRSRKQQRRIITAQVI